MKSPTPEQIKQARKDASLTQSQAAALLGMTRRTWQHWELGDRQMSEPLWAIFKIRSTALGKQ